MRNKISYTALAILLLFTGCGIFRPGCKCPKVSYAAPAAEKLPLKG